MRRRTTKPTKSNAALDRLGMATPPPFVGRDRELATLGEALHEGVLLVLCGAVGSGKTCLARELESRRDLIGSLEVAYVRCYPGDRGVAVRARAERALDALPGSLAAVLRDEQHLLIIDDVHHLAEDDAARTLAELVGDGGPGAHGRLVLITRDALPIRRDIKRVELTVEGLDEPAARELWTHLEETYGPTKAGASDAAITRTRGMPLALRREYARAAGGKDAWRIDKLGKNARRALEALTVLRVPAAPAAVAALTGTKPEPALIDLVSRQLIDAASDGRFVVHDVVRDDVFEVMDEEERRDLERRAADLVATVGKGTPEGRRLAWDAGDDGAVGQLDPVDRMRESILHLIAAGEHRAAAERLLEHRDVATTRGGGGELLAILERLEESGELDDVRDLRGVRAEIAARHGRVAEALEIGGRHAGRVDLAELSYRAGDVGGACRALGDLTDSEDPDERCRAAAVLAEIELARGAAGRAESLATAAFERDRADIDESVRARLHLALAAVEEAGGRVTAARAALSRAASSGALNPALAANIDARRAACLAGEGRLSEAASALDSAERAAREVDAVAIADDIRAARALVAARRGDTLNATGTLRTLVATRRQRGDEVGALRAEIDLARVLARRGELAGAAELAAATSAAAARKKLFGLAARADLVTASIDVAELRLASARTSLGRLVSAEHASADVRAEAAALVTLVDAWSGEPIDVEAGLETSAEIRDEIDTEHLRAALALAAGDPATALDAARAVAVRAERSGRGADLADALALCARLQLARGDKAGATAAATRAAREALSSGLSRARAGALLVLAALARDDGDLTAASAYARDASEIATEAGLPIERLVAAEAIDAIAGSDQGGNEAQSAAAATMTQTALDAATRILSDLGLTSVRPFRVVSARGADSFVADANPDLLRMGERSLAIDGVREVIVRDSEQIADLRRRSLLKRLLFLFAGAPGQIFSKEEIVQTVWDVDYHPLRHDAALFTNIMRIRRLLGKDGADLIRVSEDGYRFVPPKDFLFVEAVTEQ